MERFTFVIAVVMAKLDSESLELMDEFYKYCSKAPVYTFLAPAAHKAVLSGFNPKANFVEFDAADLKGKLAQFCKAFDWATGEVKRLLDNDIKVKFQEIDTDKSGVIEKDELGKLSANMGNPLTDEELQLALVDLDLNGDGVIDLFEFSEWYFSGMKPLSSQTRAMKKFRNRT